jgi:hypothetical protein
LFSPSKEIVTIFLSIHSNYATKIKNQYAFLNGSIEKEIYLVKKDELIKTKTSLLQKK